MKIINRHLINEIELLEQFYPELTPEEILALLAAKLKVRSKPVAAFSPFYK